MRSERYLPALVLSPLLALYVLVPLALGPGAFGDEGSFVGYATNLTYSHYVGRPEFLPDQWEWLSKGPGLPLPLAPLT
jgi:hypothetical protein